MPRRSVIDHFLDQRHLAVVGVSRHPKAFANTVYRQLRAGRTLVPVNDAAHGEPLEGDRSYERLADVPDPIEAVLLIVPPHRLMPVLGEVVVRGVPMVWIHRGIGQPPVPREAVEYCDLHGIEVVDGACPLMFDSPVRGVHRIHRFCSGRRLAT